jgi:hypothetical protein
MIGLRGDLRAASVPLARSPSLTALAAMRQD